MVAFGFSTAWARSSAGAARAAAAPMKTRR
jgi:hypothetical protein